MDIIDKFYAVDDGWECQETLLTIDDNSFELAEVPCSLYLGNCTMGLAIKFSGFSGMLSPFDNGIWGNDNYWYGVSLCRGTT